MADGYPIAPGASLTKTQPGLGLSTSRAASGPKLQIAKHEPERAHLPLSSPGGVVVSGGYMGGQMRTGGDE